MSDSELSARLDAALGVSRPMLVHPSDFELAEALLARIAELERVKAHAMDLVRAVLDGDRTQDQDHAAALLWQVIEGMAGGSDV